MVFQLQILCFTTCNVTVSHPGYSILKVAATDRDEGTNAEIEYEIESGITKDAFKIEANGDLKTTRALDRESHSSHQLVIAAKDKGTPSLRSTVPVTVTVTDQNDNTPKFDQVTIMIW